MPPLATERSNSVVECCCFALSIDVLFIDLTDGGSGDGEEMDIMGDNLSEVRILRQSESDFLWIKNDQIMVV